MTGSGTHFHNLEKVPDPEPRSLHSPAAERAQWLWGNCHWRTFLVLSRKLFRILSGLSAFEQGERQEKGRTLARQRLRGSWVIRLQSVRLNSIAFTRLSRANSSQTMPRPASSPWFSSFQLRTPHYRWRLFLHFLWNVIQAFIPQHCWILGGIPAASWVMGSHSRTHSEHIHYIRLMLQVFSGRNVSESYLIYLYELTHLKDQWETSETTC